MKRSHSDMAATLSVLPQPNLADLQLFKGTLDGMHRLRVTKVVDISKPVDKPIEEIDEPEEEDIARENNMSKNNARMIQLDLVDLNNKSIRALETEHIDMLTNVKTDSIVSIAGPVTIRCGNIMLEKKHVKNLEFLPKEEIQVLKETRKEEPSPIELPTPYQTTSPPAEAPSPTQPKLKVPTSPVVVELTKEEEVIMLEDWDEDDENDCICLD